MGLLCLNVCVCVLASRPLFLFFLAVIERCCEYYHVSGLFKWGREVINPLESFSLVNKPAAKQHSIFTKKGIYILFLSHPGVLFRGLTSDLCRGKQMKNNVKQS